MAAKIAEWKPNDGGSKFLWNVGNTSTQYEQLKSGSALTVTHRESLKSVSWLLVSSLQQ
jgi:hypothetical protein